MTMKSFSTYNLNLILASIISILLLILFFLLLHVYAKLILLRARRRRNTRRSASSLSGFLRGFHSLSFNSLPPTTGLHSSLIASIPIFLYKCDPAGFPRDNDKDRVVRDFGLECVICLSNFEEDEVGRALDKCGHAFHMECIDMWLHSHITCPICRAPAVSAPDLSQDINKGEASSWELGRNEMDVLEGDNGSSTVSREEEKEEGEVVGMVMDVFIVSVSVSRAGSNREFTTEEAA